jgi:phosphoribosylformylglycinamidine synthase
LSLAGFQTHKITVNQLIEQPKLLQQMQVFVLPGGFSFGDELGSGALLAIKLSHYLQMEIQKFLERDVMMIGICNGFQALVRMGLLPNNPRVGKVSLTKNAQGHFSNQWVSMHVAENSRCQLLQEFKSQEFYMPMRHGEGRITTQSPEHLQALIKDGHVAFYYTRDVNGSEGNIAGLNDLSGKVLGLMPHPEAALDASIFAENKNSQLGVAADGRSLCLHLFEKMAQQFNRR